MEDCIFCKIVKGIVPTKFEIETENFVVFKDINPKAAIHLLIVPKKHFRDMTEADGAIWSEVREIANQIAKEKNLSGFRIVHNAGQAAAVPHMHVHFLGDVASDREL